MSMNIYSMSLQMYNFSKNLKRGCFQNYHLIHYEMSLPITKNIIIFLRIEVY